jgi:hypothetical protein
MNLAPMSDLAQTGRSNLNANWPFKIFATDVHDVLNLSGDFTTGFPGITIDTRATGQPAYSNNQRSFPISATDNPALTAPADATLFIAERELDESGHATGKLLRFLRLSVCDIPTVDLTGEGGSSGEKLVGLWVDKLYTGEECSNKTWRAVLMSPLYEDP